MTSEKLTREAIQSNLEYYKQKRITALDELVKAEEDYYEWLIKLSIATEEEQDV